MTLFNCYANRSSVRMDRQPLAVDETRQRLTAVCYLSNEVHSAAKPGCSGYESVGINTI